MGTHRGWMTRPAGGGRHRGMVLIPGTGRYRTETWATKAKAAKWARAEAAGITLGAPAIPVAPTIVRTVDVIRDYLADMDARGRAATTQANAKLTLGRFAALVPDLRDKTAVERIRAWFAEQAAAGRAPATRNKVLVQIHALVRWAVREGRIEDGRQYDRLRPVTAPRPLKAQWTVDDLRRILAHRRYPTSKADHQQGREDAWHTAAAILVYAGLRMGEALALRWQDVDWAGGMLLIRETATHRLKTRRERIVPLQAELRAILEPLRKDGGRVVQVAPGNPRRVLAFVERAGITVGERSPHSFRHTFAGLMTATGVPSNLLAAWMGHETAQTTMGYSLAAARYVAQVEGWPRGVMKLAP